MLTRGMVAHAYTPTGWHYAEQVGFARVATVNNIPQTWAIVRPNSVYSTAEANMPVTRGGFQSLVPAKPRLEMDPSDQSTWQRDYRFDN